MKHGLTSSCIIVFSCLLMCVPSQGAELAGSPLALLAEQTNDNSHQGGGRQTSPTPKNDDTELPPLEKPKLVERPFVRSPIIATKCELAGNSAFSVSQRDKELLQLSLKKCNFDVREDGVVNATVSIQIKLNASADVAHCGTFQIAMLFEGKSSSDNFRWRGIRTLINNLIVENVEGDKRDLGYFVLYDGPSDKSASIGSIILTPGNSPGYPDIYWGDALVLREDSTGPFAAEIRRIAPLLHENSERSDSEDPPDITIKVEIEAFEPRGWCLVKDPKNGNISHELLSVVAK